MQNTFRDDISRVMSYISECLAIYPRPDLQLYEVIVTPEFPFFLMARVTVTSVTSPYSPVLDEVENDTAFFEAKGIRVVARGNYGPLPEAVTPTSEELVAIRAVLDSSPTVEDAVGLAEFPVFGEEIARIKDYVLDAVRSSYPNVWLWEIEVPAQHHFPVLARLVSKSDITSVSSLHPDFSHLDFIVELLPHDDYQRAFAFDRWARRMQIGSHRAYALKRYLASIRSADTCLP